jgi:signal peptidase I
MWLTGGSFHVRAFRQQSNSMANAVLPGDFFTVDLSDRTVNRGAVLAISCGGRSDLWCVTRLIGMAGDTVSVRDHYALIDGRLLYEVYAQTALMGATDSMANRKPVVVPPDHVWVLGDNRAESYDSRYWGFLPVSQVHGRLVRIYWSWDPDEGGVRWSRIGHRIQ